LPPTRDRVRRLFADALPRAGLLHRKRRHGLRRQRLPARGPRRPGRLENLPGDFVGVADPSVDWTNRLALRENYRQHWRYNRGDPLYKRLLRTTPMYSQWDDHEVINDFGGRWPYRPQNPEREGFPNLVAEGRKALFDWSPLRRASPRPQHLAGHP
jgi:hypothetical protein